MILLQPLNIGHASKESGAITSCSICSIFNIETFSLLVLRHCQTVNLFSLSLVSSENQVKCQSNFIWKVEVCWCFFKKKGVLEMLYFIHIN